MNVIAIFDVGKTNKKLFLFDEQYKIRWEQSAVFDETKDEDGDACEDLAKLEAWVRQSFAEVSALPDFFIRAINFAAYGASFVHIGKNGRPVAPLYNYLKPYPEALRAKFYNAYGGEIILSMLTASPVLGSLNSGMQLYRIKNERPELFTRIQHALHLPQYLSFIFTRRPFSDLTSIGCHTHLWNFSQQHYHEWVYREGLIDKLAPILSCTSVQPVSGGGRPASGGGQPVSGGGQPVSGGGQQAIVAGIGLHDSSAALIPFLANFHEPFVLISTGTWCISMNPFNHTALTVSELQKDCLCYLSYQGQPVKASRIFAGYDHEHQLRRIAEHFHQSPAYAATILFNPDCVKNLRKAADGVAAGSLPVTSPVTASRFGQRALESFESFDQAYHRLMMDIKDQQVVSTQLVLEGTAVKRIYVDGGFGKNQVYMHLLAAAFPGIRVFSASIPQATAMGAAMAIHPHWNEQVVPADMIELKYYK